MRYNMIKNNSFKTFLLVFFVLSNKIHTGEVNGWECSKFENARIIGEGGVYLGVLGPGWLADSIFNSSSSFSSTWSYNSIFNTSSIFGDSYSNTSVFNDSADSPPEIISSQGFIGYLSVGPSWDDKRYSPNDIKYTCDWD